MRASHSSLGLQRSGSSTPVPVHPHHQQLQPEPLGGLDSDEDEQFDDEAAALPPLSTLSSAEANFDRLMQGLTYRDRARFVDYVRSELDRDTHAEAQRTAHGLALTKAHSNPPTLLSHVTSAYARLPAWWQSVLDRFALLAGLLFLQSCSSMILSHFADFLSRHVVVTLYLTMLVGSGGNAGNQAAVLVIRLIATSARRVQSWAILWREVQVAMVMGALMVIVSFGRVYLFEGDAQAAFAITAALWLIVSSSIVLGAALPLLLHHFRFDPAHAGPIIQVVMDVLGVAVTCAICSTLLAGPSHAPDGYLIPTPPLTEGAHAYATSG